MEAEYRGREESLQCMTSQLRGLIDRQEAYISAIDHEHTSLRERLLSAAEVTTRGPAEVLTLMLTLRSFVGGGGGGEN